MYLRTPKRYQAGRRQKRHVFSLRWLWLWILTPLVILAGQYLYERRDFFAPQVQEMIDSVANTANDSLATVTAPTPPPTADPAEMIARGDNAWGRGAIEEAIDAYRAAMDGAPNDVRIHYRYTFGLIMEGRAEEALEAAERTITANPFVADAWAIRALALTRNGQSAAAVTSALQALSIDPNSARAMAFMAEAYFDANQPARAAELVERALEANPQSFEAYYVSGLINRDSEFDFDAALSDFEQAYDIAPNLPYLTIELAWMYQRLENNDDALVLLEEVVDLNPQNLDALFALGFINYAIYGDTERALDYLSRCVVADGQNVPCLSYLGTIQSVVDLEAAVETYAQLITAGTTNPRHYLDAARVNISSGDCRTALPLLREGYRMQQEAVVENPDREALFEDLLSDCGSPVFSAPPPAETTPDPAAPDNVPQQIPVPGSST